MRIRALAVAALAATFYTSASSAAFSLQVTEIWPGNEPGSNLTDDWFEVTNFGATAWTAATDGDLYFDDDSADPSVADLMSGVASIAAGESVVFVDGLAAEWLAVWSGALAVVPQVGEYAGSGLSQGGDGVSLFLDSGHDGPDAADLFTVAVYPDANANGGQSYDFVLNAFSVVGNASGAVATTILNDIAQPAIGSPGSVAPVPVPAAVWLLGSALAGIVGSRRKA